VARPDFAGVPLSASRLVVIGETGRQPIDNPDTHLELTMIHEGPLLRIRRTRPGDVQWAAAARHWVVLVLRTHRVPSALLPALFAQLASLVVGLPLLCVILGLTDDWQARIATARRSEAVCAGGLVAMVGFHELFLPERGHERSPKLGPCPLRPRCRRRSTPTVALRVRHRRRPVIRLSCAEPRSRPLFHSSCSAAVCVAREVDRVAATLLVWTAAANPRATTGAEPLVCSTAAGDHSRHGDRLVTLVPRRSDGPMSPSQQGASRSW